MRLRITLAAMAVVAIALILGALGLRAMQFEALESNIDDALIVRAGDLATLLRDDALPAVLTVRDVEEALVQVVGPGPVARRNDAPRGRRDQ